MELVGAPELLELGAGEAVERRKRPVDVSTF